MEESEPPPPLEELLNRPDRKAAPEALESKPIETISGMHDSDAGYIATGVHRVPIFDVPQPVTIIKAEEAHLHGVQKVVVKIPTSRRRRS